MPLRRIDYSKLVPTELLSFRAQFFQVNCWRLCVRARYGVHQLWAQVDLGSLYQGTSIVPTIIKIII